MSFMIRPLGSVDAGIVQELLLRSPASARRVRGRDVADGDGLAVLTDRPPHTASAIKTVLGLVDEPGVLRGVCDVIVPWPEAGAAHISLLLIDDAAQGRGLGRLLHDSLVAQLRAQGGVTSLRAGVAATTAGPAPGFWERLGYRLAPELRPDNTGTVESTTMLVTRELTPSAPIPSCGPPTWPTPVDAPAPSPASPHPVPGPHTGLHHLELWTADLTRTAPSWHWLLTALGWGAELVEGWELGRIWRHADGSYVVLEQSEDVVGTRSERRAPGMNHVALRAGSQDALDALRSTAPAHGWRELFPERYPHAGGADHTAWYGEDPDGIEVELVATSAIGADPAPSS